MLTATQNYKKKKSKLSPSWNSYDELKTFSMCGESSVMMY